jgi:hypothetical protein
MTAQALSGFIVVLQDEERVTVPAQNLERDRDLVVAGVARGNRRAVLASRPPRYMLAVVTVEAPLPTCAQIRAWLSAHSWQQVSEGPAGSRWSAWSGGAAVGVPGDDSDAALTIGAIERIAAAAGMTPAALLQELAAAGPDGA